MLVNSEPVTIVQYKYHEGEFGKLLGGAFNEFTTEVKPALSIFTRDGTVSVSRYAVIPAHSIDI